MAADSGKYDFSGIKKAGAAAIQAVLAGTSWGGILFKNLLRPFMNGILELLVNWLANRGLFILNIGAIYVDSKFSQAAFDKAMSEAIEKVKASGGTLTDAQKKAIDDEVIKAVRRTLPLTNPK